VSAAGLEIVLTFGAAYGCHFVTEDLLGASGLLAVVVMGFSMSILGEGFAASAAVL
jgi:NhaP-type Na+/H+ or K+/H+ antiporter